MATASPRETVRAPLTAFDVTFDVWRSERALHAAGDVAGTLTALEAARFIDRHDDGDWLRTTALWNDDKDRVVMKSDSLEENITKEDD
jgi:arginyl-tRNA synthetase